MSTAHASLPAAGGARRSAPPWLEARPLWAGVSIASMWIAVLFVGLFGGDFVAHSVDGSGTSIPTAVFLALFALIGTVVIARRAFVSDDVAELRAALEQEREARKELTAEVRQLRERAG